MVRTLRASALIDMDPTPDLKSYIPGGSYSAEDLALRHKAFVAMKWDGLSPAEVARRFYECYGILPMVILEATCEQFGCPLLHRARWLDPGEEDPDDRDTYSYPRSVDRQVMGRSNLPGVPMFYTCGSVTGSLDEADRSTNASAQLMHSEWRPVPPESWKVASMIPPDRICTHLPLLMPVWERGLREFILKSGNIPQEYLLFLYTCVTELFLTETYEVTSWISHRIVQEMGSADVITYPSSMAGDQDVCLAFRTAPIDAGQVVLHRVEQVVKLPEGCLAIREGFPKESRMIWEHIQPRPLVRGK